MPGSEALPTVTVLMSVYNGDRYLLGSVSSILNQTYTDFEFIVVDDGSTDASLAVLESVHDARFRLIRNAANLGLTSSLNRGLALARGRYVARQDADDISAPERLARQVAFLDAHPRVAFVGSAALVIDDRGRSVAHAPVPMEQPLADVLRAYNPLYHGSVMFRCDAALTAGGYDEALRYAQDYDLWLRLMVHGEVAALPESLYHWRLNIGSITLGATAEQAAFALAARQRAAYRQSGAADGDPLPLPADSGEMLAGAYLWLAYLSLAAGVDEVATEMLARVVESCPVWLADEAWLRAWWVARATEQADLRADPNAGAGLLDRLLTHLPPCLVAWATQVRTWQGEFWISQAFTHRDQRRADSGRLLRAALRSDPALLRRRGVRSLVVRTALASLRGRTA